eukprot:15452683-Alexandrium_andersonii.AAC.1
MCSDWLPAREDTRIARIADWRIADWRSLLRDVAPLGPPEAPLSSPDLESVREVAQNAPLGSF